MKIIFIVKKQKIELLQIFTKKLINLKIILKH